MQTKASSPPRGVGIDERLPVLPKVHMPLKASLQDTPPPKGFVTSLQDGVAKWLQKKKPEPAIDSPPQPVHTGLPEKTELRKQRSACQILLGANSRELPMLDMPEELCSRCHGFLKHDAIPCLPDDWTECKLNSGRTGFLNTKTNEKLALPPPGMPPTSCVLVGLTPTQVAALLGRRRRTYSMAQEPTPRGRRPARRPPLLRGGSNNALCASLPVMPKVYLPLKTYYHIENGLTVDEVLTNLHIDPSTTFAPRKIEANAGHRDMDALIEGRPKPKDILCPRCRGFRKESNVPELPPFWIETCRTSSGKCAFYNTRTKETLDFPPWGTPAISSTVFHHHGTTQCVCRCNQSRRHTALAPVGRAKTSHGKRTRYHSVVGLRTGNM
ncbi:hypothetical protein SDRG_00072 [Saprolegnia diclina VS20]|uniref:Uncharacterized protein n=1 Tax=Saprolegnia diclina (strain VS20) TaxID=1156394 RepID=T0SAI0_SAPDV|nr:hypothetical protein SDRG_00072 [Saprolegnia diclina VS20]EQC42333.1 hypothetical protein SDRG_00072 [Saprolegnia diclina VS20]|eukprot:XP_008603756.1 hypothetical protein SDRG_00072 [Saprolegnia diclina VS20]